MTERPPTQEDESVLNTPENTEMWVNRLHQEVRDITSSSENILTGQEGADIPPAQVHIESLRLNNREVTFVGVQHTPETLLKYQSEITDAIRNADVVVLEYSPEIQLGGKTMREDLVERLGEMEVVDDLTPEELRDRYINQQSEPEKFFFGVSNIAAIEGKRIALLDPTNALGGSHQEELDFNDLLQKDLPERVGNSGMIMSAAGLAASAALTALEDPEKIDRRSFLKKILKTSAAIGATAAASQFAQQDLDRPDGHIREMSDSRRRTEEMLAFGLNDLRNITVSENIEQLAMQLPEGSKIAVVYGDGHRKSIMADYLPHADLRNAKKLVYEPIRPALPERPAIGIWEFNMEEGHWEQLPMRILLG
jgi:hypothetical protein